MKIEEQVRTHLQDDFIESDHSIVGIQGPPRTGKTWALVEKLYKWRWENPRAKCTMLAPNYDMLLHLEREIKRHPWYMPGKVFTMQCTRITPSWNLTGRALGTVFFDEISKAWPPHLAEIFQRADKFYFTEQTMFSSLMERNGKEDKYGESAEGLRRILAEKAETS